MIETFGHPLTADIFHGIASHRVRRLPRQVIEPARRRLDCLNAAVSLNDLKRCPGIRFNVPRGDYRGFYSITINDHWCVVFRWLGSGTRGVAVVHRDY